MMQPTNPPVVVGVFPNRAAAEQTRSDLEAAGFSADQIGILVRSEAQAAASTPRTGQDEAGPGAAAGVIAGGILGALASLLIPGLGLVLAGGALAAALGAGVGAATGGLVGALIGMGIPEPTARHYEAQVRSGRAIVTVAAGPREPEAAAILQRDGGAVEETSPLNNPRNITDTVGSTAERYPSPSQPIEASRSIPQSGIGPNLIPDLDEPVTPNEVSERE